MQPARKRNAWMPNRMFDPASNPFAVQNLLERDVPPFVAEHDERPDAAFGVDPLAGGGLIKAFEIDRGLQMPDEDFAVDASVSDEFVAEASEPEAGFDAGDEPDLYAAFTAGLDEDVDASPAAADTDTDAAELLAMVEGASDTELQETAAVAESERLASQEVVEPVVQADETHLLADAATQTTDETASTEIDAETVSEAVASADPEMALSSEPEQPAEPDLTSEAVTQMVEAARADAYAQGLETGRSEGRDAERPLAHQQGYDEGFAAGAAQAKAESQSDEQKRQQEEHQAKLDQLQAVIDNLQQLAYNPDAMFEPVKKLAVFLAEQLVRGELTQSPQVISRLVDNALRELNASGDKAVIIHLNPEDLETYRPTVANFADSLILRPDTMLERGSVRVSLDGSVVEDLMQRRVEGLKKSMAQAPAPGWRSGGGTLASRVQQGQPVDDVTIVEKKDKTLEAAAPADGHA